METDYSIGVEAVSSLPTRASARRAWSYRAARYALLHLLQRIEHGSLRLRLPDGETLMFSGRVSAAPAAELVIDNARALGRLLRGGDIGFAESYLDGDWHSPDLLALISLACRNEQAFAKTLDGGRLARALNRLYHWRRHNNRRGSRRNIAFHYDLGNAFYRQWLDPSMTYSAALFDDPSYSLAQAQQAKYRRIAELAQLQAGDRVLEIGCGWGGFMEYAAGHHACQVHGLTLSREQLAYANQRLRAAGLAARASASLTDYRDSMGQYDALVSIEMLEAVGEAHWPRYFRTLRERLKPGGRAVVQVITIAEQRFADYRKTTDFIQRHVFPGGMLPSPAILHQQAAGAGLLSEQQETFGLSYARTLALWRQAFHRAWPEIAGQGFDQRFRRLWEYYLCYCEAGFRAGTIDVGIYRFRRPE
jgi:cyclopropane-fatty-acyl-phospholipid synthase